MCIFWHLCIFESYIPIWYGNGTLRSSFTHMPFLPTLISLKSMFGSSRGSQLFEIMPLKTISTLKCRNVLSFGLPNQNIIWMNMKIIWIRITLHYILHFWSPVRCFFKNNLFFWTDTHRGYSYKNAKKKIFKYGEHNSHSFLITHCLRSDRK